jgi:TonB family protein
MPTLRNAVPAAAHPRPGQGPRLLVEWSRWDQVFLDNLADLLLGSGPQARITAAPAEFWPDVFVRGGLPWRRLLQSALYHVFFVVAVWGFSVTWLQRPQVPRRSPFENSKLTYYSVSEYLPEINGGETQPPKERRGQPAYAKQKILSLPPAPDNRRQTIITPSKIRLPQEAPLPNLVAWTPIPAPVPEAAMNHARLIAPAPAIMPVAPAPDPRQASERLRALPTPDVVQPPADPNAARARINLPQVPGPEVVGPPPSLEGANARAKAPALPMPAVVGPPVGRDATRNLGAMNIAHAEIDVAAPRLPVSEQRPAIMLRPGTGAHGSGGSGGAQAATAPPPSIVVGTGTGRQDIGQLIALSVEPAPVSGPIEVPAGSRHGEFATGPEGKPGAPGTPDIRGTDGNGGGNHGATPGPPGIMVAPGPTPVPPGPVVAGKPALEPAPAAKVAPPLLASIRPTPVTELARATRPGATIPAPEAVDAKVFGAKKYYSMIANMPNLTSAGGSWIIRFAELHETRGELTAPVATLTVDPAYPPELIRDGLGGTVTVYAVIRRDGSVGQARVLQGFDQTLNENARIAVLRWHFRPAMKNGEAVDLEAVFHVPFVARRPAY